MTPAESNPSVDPDTVSRPDDGPDHPTRTHPPPGTNDHNPAGTQTRPPASSEVPPSLAEFAGRLAEMASPDLDATGSLAPPTDEPAPLPPGTVPGYELLEPIGRGGMGVVYKARQAKLNRVVALKMVLGGQRANTKQLIRFLAEAEAAAAVKHPHVVQVFEFGDADGRPFLAMEYLPGGTLTERLKADGRLAPRAAADLVGRLAAAVQAAHDLGIVHRDVKPGNVLFDETDVPKVTDFGVAKRGTGGDLTATHAVMGTPAYMAPEQARGNTKFVGPTADIYALGVILYECLTGTRPFDAPNPMALLHRVAEEEPEPPSKRVAGVPQDIDLICRKCLEKDPADRYPTAAALPDDLRRFAAGEPVSVRSAGLLERTYKWARRKPAVAGLYAAAAVGAVLVGFAVVVGLLWRDAADARDQLATEKNQTEVARR
ncbi:MAG TPA: protein kinase, partial [Gemmataceae bacterium]|nr:protein kinase [Gemmataceae bacterium]